MSYLVIWEFHPKPDSIPTFEKIYGPGGDWAQLFRLSPDFLGTELVRDRNHSGRYLTLDRWTSHDAFHQFKQDHRAEYDALDHQCENLTELEHPLGEFETFAAQSIP